MTDETDIIGALIGEGARADEYHPDTIVWTRMGVRAAVLRGYEAGRAAVHAELDLLRKPFLCDEDWREGFQPIDDGSKAVPPGEEFDSDAVIAEVRSVLEGLDALAALHGDGVLSKTARDRLRALLPEGK